MNRDFGYRKVALDRWSTFLAFWDFNVSFWVLNTGFRRKRSSTSRFGFETKFEGMRRASQFWWTYWDNDRDFRMNRMTEHGFARSGQTLKLNAVKQRNQEPAVNEDLEHQEDLDAQADRKDIKVWMKHAAKGPKRSWHGYRDVRETPRKPQAQRLCSQTTKIVISVERLQL